jgi:flagellar hook assembly protein FlgD
MSLSETLADTSVFKLTPNARKDVQKAEKHLLQQRENNIYAQHEEGKFTSGMVLGKFEESIKLLIAMLKHQSPDDPLKPAEIAAQFNGFAQTLGMLEIKKLLETYAKAGNTSQLLQAAAQLDKLVEVKGSHFFYDPQTPCELGFNIPEGIEKASITITDTHNRALRILSTGVHPGKNKYIWDGKDFNGDPVKPGKYLFRVQAIDKDNRIIQDDLGKDLEIETFVSGIVRGGGIHKNTAYLNIGGADYPLDSLLAIQSVSRDEQSKMVDHTNIDHTSTDHTHTHDASVHHTSPEEADISSAFSSATTEEDTVNRLLSNNAPTSDASTSTRKNTTENTLNRPLSLSGNTVLPGANVVLSGIQENVMP